MIKQLKSFLTSYKQYQIDDKKKISLDLLLAAANSKLPLEERVEWILSLFKWIKSEPVLKIKYFLMILENNSKWKMEVSLIFQNTLKELSAIEFFCEVGLPNQAGFIGELSEKIMAKILPNKAIENQLGELLLAIFPEKDDAMWLTTLDHQTLTQLFKLFQSDEESTFPHLENDIEEALIYLTSQIIGIGLSPLVRKRIPHAKMKALPFLFLSAKLKIYLRFKNNDIEHLELKNNLYYELQHLLGETQKCVDSVYSHLDQYGVSVHLVYQLERLKSFINRTSMLLEINHTDIVPMNEIVYFTADLIKQNQIQNSIKSLFSGNLTLLAQKIVERNSHKGEHYIAQNIHEYGQMFKKALGGGIITALTVYIKNFIVSLPLTRFFIGAFGSVNYSLSFLAIHFSGFTLATKQPASTAPALAQKLGELNKIKQIENVTDEIVMVARTQFIAVAGNLLAVVPTVLAIDLLFHYFTGNWILDFHAAEHNLTATDLFGPAILFAIFTGFLLWLSSVAAGWTENWFAFNNLHSLLANNKKWRLILGKAGAKKLASFLEHNISGIAGNISLGLLLGVVPEVLKFVGIPLEVRHITLQTGAIAAALPTLGLGILKTALFWRCFIGLLVVGFLNIFVSFALAFFVAVRAKKISTRKRRLIYRSVWKRFIQRPISFFIPS